MTLSANANKEVNRVNAYDLPVTLLEITHPDLVTPVRVVNDTQDITFETNTYTALGFRLALPSDLQKQNPRALLAIDNVGKELVSWLESSDGGAGAQARIVQVLRSAPTVAELDITMSLTNIKVTPVEVTATLGFDDLLNIPAITKVYNPVTAPALY